MGASGAIAGVIGACVVLFPRVKIYSMTFVFRIKPSVWFYLGGWIFMNMLMGSVALVVKTHGGGTAWFAHIGGFVAGALWALWNRKKLLAA